MASPPGAVPPSADGEPDLPPGIAPPPELGVSATISAAPDAVAASVAGWAGSADAHAAAWAAYQQQCAYQHAGADWGAYNAAWANEWARHNEAAAAAAAAPSAERLAAVAAKIAEQIAEAEKNENETRRVAPVAATAEAKEATTAGPPGILPADDEAKQPEKPDVMGTDLEVSPRPPPPPPPPPPSSSPPSPPPAPPEPAGGLRGAGDAETKTSARAETSPNRAARRDGPGPRSDRSAPALIPRQIPAPPGRLSRRTRSGAAAARRAPSPPRRRAWRSRSKLRARVCSPPTRKRARRRGETGTAKRVTKPRANGDWRATLATLATEAKKNKRRTSRIGSGTTRRNTASRWMMVSRRRYPSPGRAGTNRESRPESPRRLGKGPPRRRRRRGCRMRTSTKARRLRIARAARETCFCLARRFARTRGTRLRRGRRDTERDAARHAKKTRAEGSRRRTPRST